LQPVGEAAAFVHVADINKGKFTHDYQAAMSFLVTEFTFLEGRDGGLVFKDLAAVVSHFNRVSSYVFKRSYSWEKVLWFNARMN